MRFVSARFACLAALLLGAPACDAIFGITGGVPEGTGGSASTSSSAGHTSSNTGAGHTSSASTGAAGHGGSAAGSTGSGGAAGSSTAGTTSSSSTTGAGGMGTGGGSTCTPGSVSCAGSKLTVCDATGHGQTTDCGVAASCDAAGQVCATHPTLSLGASRGCVIDGKAVYCWGQNGGSPAGFGTLFVDDAHLMVPTPAKVPGVTAPVQVAVADVHQCALLGDGSVTCWGDNQFDVLGTGNQVTTNTLAVHNGVAVEIGVAPGCSCARLGDASGSVWCWGLQDNGCFGDGAAGNDQTTNATPAQVPLGGPAVEIRIGDGDGTPSCARLATGDVACWGRGYGPTAVPVVNDAQEIAVGWGFVFIRRMDGSVWVTQAVPPSSGAGGGGGAGGAAAPDGGADAGATGWALATPVLYVGAGTAKRITAGNSFCATSSGTMVLCQELWGVPSDPTMWPQPTPATAPGSPVEIASEYGGWGYTAQCLRISGVPAGQGVYCWGMDDSGGLGVGGPEYPNTPQAVTFSPAPTSMVATVTCGTSSTNVTFADGSVRYWGNGGAYLPNGPQQSTPSPPLTNLAAKNALIRTRDGWDGLYDMKTGGAPAQLLEDGNSAPGTRLLAWSATNYVDAYPGMLNNHVDMGLLANGQVVVYADPATNPGANDVGLFGDGTTTTPATPTLKPVPLPFPATALAAYGIDWGDYPAHACAILNTGASNPGALYCWGSNLSGESAVAGLPLVNVLSPTQVTIPGVTQPIVSVATGQAFACATDGPTGTGQVYCWGADDFGQLGNGGYSQGGNAVPAAVQGINNGGATVPAKGVTAGDQHACAWLADGSVACWGCNDVGQLGTGDYDTQPTATPVTGLAKSVSSVSAYVDHTCALYADGTVACWGSSYNGQVGNGFTAAFPSPTMVQGLP